MLFKKVTTFSARPPNQNIHQEVARRGMCPFLFGGLKGAAVPLIAKENFGLVRGLK
jgi:hypothetical protein